jgi:hypothetical protein
MEESCSLLKLFNISKRGETFVHHFVRDTQPENSNSKATYFSKIKFNKDTRQKKQVEKKAVLHIFGAREDRVFEILDAFHSQLSHYCLQQEIFSGNFLSQKFHRS